MAITTKAIAEATGRRIRERRQQRGWSQERLAREAAPAVSKETVRRAEAGVAIPDWSTLEALAAGLECELADLLDLGARGRYRQRPAA